MAKDKLKHLENKIEFKTNRIVKTVLKSIYPAGSFLPALIKFLLSEFINNVSLPRCLTFSEVTKSWI